MYFTRMRHLSGKTEELHTAQLAITTTRRDLKAQHPIISQKLIFKFIKKAIVILDQSLQTSYEFSILNLNKLIS